MTDHAALRQRLTDALVTCHRTAPSPQALQAKKDEAYRWLRENLARLQREGGA